MKNVEFFREANEPGRGGVLLQISSIVGIAGLLGMTFYSASKHALDGFSEGLAKEFLPEWNIKICIIGAGMFKTNVISNSTHLPENPVYGHDASSSSRLAALCHRLTAPESSASRNDPVKFAKAIYSLVESGRMPLHLPIGRDALALAKAKVESLEKDISEAAPWSADLLRNDPTAS